VIGGAGWKWQAEGVGRDEVRDEVRERERARDTYDHDKATPMRTHCQKAFVVVS